MKKNITLFASFILLFVGCEGAKKNSAKISDVKPRMEGLVDYNIPSPAEQFSIYASLDVEKKTSLLLDLSKGNTYNSQAQKVINFGVYVADLGYLSSFNESSSYVKYFNELEKMGKQIGISQVFSIEIKNKVKRLENTPDSLFSLSSDLYNETFFQMIENGKGDELSLMLIGGWIESAFLMLSSSDNFNQNPLLDQFLADQKPVLENLISFASVYKSNAAVKSNLETLENINKAFSKLKCSSTNTEVKKEKGKISISGGDVCLMTQEAFTQMKSAILTARKSITN